MIVEGKAVERRLTIGDLGLKEATIVSFDINTKNRCGRSAIQRFLYGRTDTKILNGGMKTYRYPGLLDEGGLRLGQSVFLLPSNLASRLILKLRELEISHCSWEVLVNE